eukprot:ANDGO_03610.mRNA.1 hypothetical protein
MVQFTFSPERKQALRKQLFLLQLSVPVMIVSGVVLYKRWFGTPEEQAKYPDFQRSVQERRSREEEVQTKHQP